MFGLKPVIRGYTGPIGRAFDQTEWDEAEHQSLFESYHRKLDAR